MKIPRVEFGPGELREAILDYVQRRVGPCEAVRVHFIISRVDELSAECELVLHATENWIGMKTPGAPLYTYTAKN